MQVPPKSIAEYVEEITTKALPANESPNFEILFEAISSDETGELTLEIINNSPIHFFQHVINENESNLNKLILLINSKISRPANSDEVAGRFITAYNAIQAIFGMTEESAYTVEPRDIFYDASHERTWLLQKGKEISAMQFTIDSARGVTVFGKTMGSETFPVPGGKEKLLGEVVEKELKFNPDDAASGYWQGLFSEAKFMLIKPLVSRGFTLRNAQLQYSTNLGSLGNPNLATTTIYEIPVSSQDDPTVTNVIPGKIECQFLRQEIVPDSSKPDEKRWCYVLQKVTASNFLLDAVIRGDKGIAINAETLAAAAAEEHLRALVNRPQLEETGIDKYITDLVFAAEYLSQSLGRAQLSADYAAIVSLVAAADGLQKIINQQGKETSEAVEAAKRILHKTMMAIAQGDNKFALHTISLQTATVALLGDSEIIQGASADEALLRRQSFFVARFSELKRSFFEELDWRFSQQKLSRKSNATLAKSLNQEEAVLSSQHSLDVLIRDVYGDGDIDARWHNMLKIAVAIGNDPQKLNDKKYLNNFVMAFDAFIRAQSEEVDRLKAQKGEKNIDFLKVMNERVVQANISPEELRCLLLVISNSSKLCSSTEDHRDCIDYQAKEILASGKVEERYASSFYSLNTFFYDSLSGKVTSLIQSREDGLSEYLRVVEMNARINKFMDDEKSNTDVRNRVSRVSGESIRGFKLKFDDAAIAYRAQKLDADSLWLSLCRDIVISEGAFHREIERIKMEAPERKFTDITSLFITDMQSDLRQMRDSIFQKAIAHLSDLTTKVGYNKTITQFALGIIHLIKVKNDQGIFESLDVILMQTVLQMVDKYKNQQELGDITQKFSEEFAKAKEAHLLALQGEIAELRVYGDRELPSIQKKEQEIAEIKKLGSQDIVAPQELLKFISSHELSDVAQAKLFQCFELITEIGAMKRIAQEKQIDIGNSLQVMDELEDLILKLAKSKKEDFQGCYDACVRSQQLLIKSLLSDYSQDAANLARELNSKIYHFLLSMLTTNLIEGSTKLPEGSRVPAGKESSFFGSSRVHDTEKPRPVRPESASVFKVADEHPLQLKGQSEEEKHEVSAGV